MAHLLSYANGEHFIALFLIVILTGIMAGRRQLSDRVRQNSIWLTITVCFLLILQDILENFAAEDLSRIPLRVCTSVAGYVLRPMAALGFLLVVWSNERKRWYLWIPAVLNALVYGTAFFSPIAFGFDEANHFMRGPLGYFFIPVSLIYLVLTLLVVHSRFRDRRAGHIGVLFLCSLGCLVSSFIDIQMSTHTIISVILISTMYFYMFLRAQDTDRDPLTRLFNRMTFYEDSRMPSRNLSAVASIDMNGLKQLNDSFGHSKGDQALQTIGDILHSVSDRDISAYRIGGDEFVLFFSRCSRERITSVMNTVSDRVTEAGLVISSGLAVRENDQQNAEDLIRLSDQRMYENKRLYYQTHDRRRRREPAPEASPEVKDQT